MVVRPFKTRPLLVFNGVPLFFVGVFVGDIVFSLLFFFFSGAGETQALQRFVFPLVFFLDTLTFRYPYSMLLN